VENVGKGGLEKWNGAGIAAASCRRQWLRTPPSKNSSAKQGELYFFDDYNRKP